MLLKKSILSLSVILATASALYAEPEPPMESTTGTAVQDVQKQPSSKQRLEDLAASGSAWAKARLEGKATTPQPVRRRVSKAPGPKPEAVTKTQSKPDTAVKAAEPAAAEAPVAAPKVSEPVKPISAEDQKVAAAVAAVKSQSAAPAEKEAGTFDMVGAAAGFLLRLGMVIVLVYLTVAAIKMYWMRSGKPFKFSSRALVVEESAPLSTGTAVHLVRLGEKRYLVGTAQGQVNILSEVAPDASPAMAAAKPEQNDTPEPSPSLTPKQVAAFQAQLPPLVRKLMEKPSKRPPMPATGVARNLNQSAQFIDEIRSRLTTPGKRGS